MAWIRSWLHRFVKRFGLASLFAFLFLNLLSAWLVATVLKFEFYRPYLPVPPAVYDACLPLVFLFVMAWVMRATDSIL